MGQGESGVCLPFRRARAHFFSQVPGGTGRQNEVFLNVTNRMLLTFLREAISYGLEK